MFLRMVARPLMAKVKQTTGIKKVPESVVPNSREVIIGLFSQILNEIKKFPEDSTYRKFSENYANWMLKIFQEDEDLATVPSRLFKRHSQVEELIKETREGLKGICVWNSIQSLSKTQFVPYERPLLIHLSNEALNVVRTNPRNDELKLFAESCITHTLEVCQEEDDWESIKSKLHCEDPIGKARYELHYCKLFYGPDTRPIRQRHVPASPKPKLLNLKKWISNAMSDISKKGLLGKDTLAVDSSDQSPVNPKKGLFGKDTPAVNSSESPFKP